MIIRRAQAQDLKPIADLQLESWKDTYAGVLPKDYFFNQAAADIHRHWCELKISNDDVVLVAENKEIIGFIAVWCRPDPFIDNLHVKPSHRGQKIGFAMMEAVAQILFKLGKKTAYLWVFLSNKKAIRFYEKLGGVRKEEAIKMIFGHEVLSVKIEWEDISVIYES